jgi:hypothetical protein
MPIQAGERCLTKDRCFFLFTTESPVEGLTSRSQKDNIIDHKNEKEVLNMLIQYIKAALEHAKYEIIDDEEPYYGEVPKLQGVWASGKTPEEFEMSKEVLSRKVS